MADSERASAATPEGLRARLKERLSALKGELERLRFETDRRWDELLARLTDRPEDIVPEELLRQTAAALATAAGRSGTVPAAAARRLDAASSQVEVLTAFLEECSRHASRAALLVERRGKLEVWKSAGFDEGRKPAGPPAVAIDVDGVLARMRAGTPQLLPAGNGVSAALGAADASEAILVPFVVREKVSGAVYADARGDDRRLDSDAVALLTWIAGLVVDRLARRRLVPSPALRGLETSRAADSDASEASPSFASVPPAQEPAAPLPRESGVAPPSPAPAAEDRRRAQAPSAAGSSARGLGGPLAPSAAEESREEARRFARLLASEIKLYNEREVSEGRARGDLYARLRDSIERGRRLYEERIPADVRTGSDYYNEELVHVLAGGRPEALK